MPLPGLTHSVSGYRYQATIDADYTPIDTAVLAWGPVPGYVHEFSSQEQAIAATLGNSVAGNALLPYGTAVQDEDLIQATFNDGTTTKKFRVVAVRDNHINLSCDIARNVD